MTATSKRSDLQTEEIRLLSQRILTEAPERGSVDITTASFADLPLSKDTLVGLRESSFKHMTRIQRIAIPHALAGRDVLGAAKTGSGKTLGQLKSYIPGFLFVFVFFCFCLFSFLTKHCSIFVLGTTHTKYNTQSNIMLYQLFHGSFSSFSSFFSSSSSLPLFSFSLFSVPMHVAFLIPTMERLYRERWAADDGIGALIISPTRELALQIFEVLRNIARGHVGITAALITGGKDFSSEQAAVGRMNIIVCTPGRLLQHFEQTPSFQCDDLKILVLDEADRILDLGFSNEVSF